MTEKSLFISSCSRRQMARRRPMRSRSVTSGSPLLMLAVALIVALALLLMLGAL
jgi:hypothetical protein